MQLTFMSQGDAAYFPTIQLSVHQAGRFYPDAPFYVYDWGFSPAQAAHLQQMKNVVLIDWKEKLIQFDSSKFVNWSDLKKPGVTVTARFKALILKYLLLKPDAWRSVRQLNAEHRSKESLLCNKPFCILDCLNRHKSSMVFLDGDAFLIDRIDEFLGTDFDIGVTLRRPHEISFRVNGCQALNSGVISFGPRHQNTTGFLKYWINFMQGTSEYLVEQTALTRLIHVENRDIFNGYYRFGAVSTGEALATVKTFPCDIYNYNWIEEGIDRSVIKIVHLKGGRHPDKRSHTLLESLAND